MPEDRRLAAIMFTDIVGYTALMGSNEDKAFHMLRKNREIHKPLIKKYHGEWFKEMGDGILASFNSSSDAVRCAGEIQQLAKKADIPLRIGIHQGEVVFEGIDVFGDGVNIASRLQESADEGCITISGSVYRDIKNKFGIRTEFIEERWFKNVDEPVRVYAVTYVGSQIIPATKNTTDSDLPEKKSIIVLPFVNISPEPDQEYFSDGLTEEIITDLSHIPDLLVISRSSAMTFKGTKKKISEIAGEVNVRYALEGSVRKAGNNLRITAQLIDGINDTHIWSDKYTGTLEDIFDIQERVSQTIANALKIKLSSWEKKKIQERPIDNVFAYDCYRRAFPEINSMSKKRLDIGLKLLLKALDIAGENAVIYAGVAFTFLMYANIGIEQEEYLSKADEFVHKALDLDKELAEAHFTLGGIIILKDGDMIKALDHWVKAHKSKPEDPEIMVYLSLGYDIVGRDEIARSLVEKCAKIDPINPLNDAIAGWNHFFGGRFDFAFDSLLAAYNLSPENPMHQFFKALILVYNIRANEAHEFICQNVEEPGENIWSQVTVFLKYVIKRDKDKLTALLTPDFIRKIQRDVQYSYHLATFYAYLGEKEKSLEYLENAVTRGFINYPLLNEHDKLLVNIRGEDRFKKLMERVKYEWENIKV